MTSSLISQAVDFTLATNETNVCGIRKATITSMMVLSRDCDGEARERVRVRVPACYYRGAARGIRGIIATKHFTRKTRLKDQLDARSCFKN